MPRTRHCGAIAWRCWRSCATSSRASRTCPACRADALGLTTMQMLGSLLFNVFPVPVDAGVRDSRYCVDRSVPLVPRPLLDGRRHDARGVLRGARVVRHPLHRRGPRESAGRQSRDLHEALFDLGNLRDHDPVPAAGVGHEARDPVDPVRRLGLRAGELHRHRSQGRARRRSTRCWRRAKDRMARGAWILVFPEGTRMAAGETRRYGSQRHFVSRAGKSQDRSGGAQRRILLAAPRCAQEARHRFA